MKGEDTLTVEKPVDPVVTPEPFLFQYKKMGLYPDLKTEDFIKRTELQDKLKAVNIQEADVGHQGPHTNPWSDNTWYNWTKAFAEWKGK